MRHRLVRTVGRVEEVRKVVVERGLPMTVATRGAEGQSLRGQRRCRLDVPGSSLGEREVVHRGHARAGIAQLLGELDARAEMLARHIRLAPTRRKDAEHVVRLGERLPVLRGLGQAERLLGEHECAGVVATAMLVETSIGVEPRALRIVTDAVERGLVVRRREVPVTTPVVDRPQLVLEARKGLAIGYRSCGLVGSTRRPRTRRAA